MKSLINLSTALLVDTGRICSVETARDLITIKKRAQHEGISFFTITLPDFATDFERSLELGRVDSTLFSGWRRRGCLPAFLRGFTSLVFGANGGVLDEPNCDAVYCIRQICRVFKKVRLACSAKREYLAFKSYLANEAALPDGVSDSYSRRYRHFGDTARVIWPLVFGSEFNTFGLVPRHGPGATAEKVSGNAKFSHLVWYDRLERSFPVTEHYFTSVNHMLDDSHGLSSLTMVSEDNEQPVRVIHVPKTLKAPRIIAIEPVCMQYTQQAVSRFITKAIKRSEITKHSIRFDDQTVNQRLALSASSDKAFSTIDLSDASDRVPLFMVRIMLQSCPDLLDAIEACRSRRANLPGVDSLTLKKFASMGSALCFPVESMYFFTIIVHALLMKYSLPPSHHNLLQVARWVHVFGDDIIVPSDETDTVLEALAYYYCKVNTTKSFWRGNFRESCGLDAFRGVDVTPIYLREMCPSSRHASSGLVSWIATSNLFHKAGCWATADFMKREVERQLGSLPVVLDTSPGLGWFSFLGIPKCVRQCTYLHRPIVRTYTVRTKRVRDTLNGYPALLKYFLRSAEVAESDIGVDNPMPRSLAIDKKHLASSARSGYVSRKRRWVPAG